MPRSTLSIVLLLVLAALSLNMSTTRARPAPSPRDEAGGCDALDRRRRLIARALSIPQGDIRTTASPPAFPQPNAPDIRVDLTRKIDDDAEAAWNKLYARPEVPTPATTPFDNNPEARRAYIRYYQRGFRIGYSGTFTTCCMFGLSPIISACIKGHYDGQRDGTHASRESGPVHDQFVKMTESAIRSAPVTEAPPCAGQPNSAPAAPSEPVRLGPLTR